MKRLTIGLVVLTIVSLALVGCVAPPPQPPQSIKIGVISELTGAQPAVGASCKNAAELAVQEINAAGGLEVSTKKYNIELVVEDNAGEEDKTISAAQKLITLDNVLAVVGPNASRYAIPASWIAENTDTPMISPWSTNPETTFDTTTNKPKEYVFRAAFTDDFQGRVDAVFALSKLGARRAAVLYDADSAYNRGLAEYFKQAFTEGVSAEAAMFTGVDGNPLFVGVAGEGLGQGSVQALNGEVVAFESYHTGDQDFTEQLNRIKAANPDLIFLPNYYDEVPRQIQQARAMGISAQFMGGDTWSSSELLERCGTDCEGAYFSAHYAPDNPTAAAKAFTASYTAKYGAVPDDVAALTYDAFQLLFRALQSAAKVDRRAVRDAMARTSNFAGVTGTFGYEGGDPVKSTVIMQIKDGKFAWFANAQP